jgi:FKBP-type peptidyl-prolyl cis-trans isomerase FklB
MRIATLIPIVLLATPAGIVCAGETMKLDNETARTNYSLGYQIGGDLKRQGVEIDAAAITRGIEDALSDAKPLMPPEEMQNTLVEFKRKLVTEQRARLKQAERQSVDEGKKYMEQYGKQAGVVTTPSGLQYKLLEAGSGKTPGPTDTVTVNYRGTLVDGKKFDSSYDKGKPITFPLNGVIKGWTEGLQHVKEGGKIQLVIPPELAYGNRGPLAHRTLIFDVELISVGNPHASATTPPAATGKPAANP